MNTEKIELNLVIAENAIRNDNKDGLDQFQVILGTEFLTAEECANLLELLNNGTFRATITRGGEDAAEEKNRPHDDKLSQIDAGEGGAARDT